MIVPAIMPAKTMTVQEIADLVGGTVEGDASRRIEGIASVDSAGPSKLTFAADQKRAAQLAASQAGAAIVGKAPVAAAMPLIRVDNVQAAMAKLLGELAGSEDLPPAGVHPSAVVAPDAQIGPGVAIGPGAVVGARASIGAGGVLCAHACVGADAVVGEKTILFEGAVVRYGCVVGRRVRIGPNTVIGYDGFGYYTEHGVHHKIPHIGNVVIEDDVEFGACSCVDRGKFDSTRVGAGTKVDNLVQIAHNVQVGRGCILVGQCGIAGSARLGDYVVLGGGTGVRDNVTLGDGVQCAAHSAIAADVADGEVVAGTPAGPAKEVLRMLLASKKLPDLLKRVAQLQARLEALESSKDN